MTQDETQRLLIRIIDELEFIVYYQEFLKIAVEQISKPNDKTLDRVDLLLTSYLSCIECHFDNIEWYIQLRDKLQVDNSTVE